MGFFLICLNRYVPLTNFNSTLVNTWSDFDKTEIEQNTDAYDSFLSQILLSQQARDVDPMLV